LAETNIRPEGQQRLDSGRTTSMEVHAGAETLERKSDVKLASFCTVVHSDARLKGGVIRADLSQIGTRLLCKGH